MRTRTRTATSETHQGDPRDTGVPLFESEGSNAGLEPHTHYFAGTEAELTQALQDLECQINEYEGEEEDVF